ncbi:DUF2336 domain-containing protein [Methylobacterium sp. NFXW15]|uniref:DUF2336 domain-containing protein n=1 Tax=Methylobacterium sp. NFXW15 TaxID=2819512 RepID=UPI003CF99EC1
MNSGLGRAPLPRLDLLVRDIEAAIISKDRARQSELVLRSAAALTRRWSRLPPAAKPGFDGLLSSLLDQVDTEARATFARHLAPLRRAPRVTTTRLACDPSLAVATPLLEQCPSFDEEWLLQIIPRVGEAHRAAIATRPSLGTAVTDALLKDDHPAVAAALLTNPGAVMQVESLKTLLPRASVSLPLTLALAARADLPEAGREMLASLARGAAVAALSAEGEWDADEAEALLGPVAGPVALTFRASACPDRLARLAASVEAAGRVLGAKPVSSARIANWLYMRRVEDVLAILARDATLPTGVLIASHDAFAPHALAVILRGLGHPWSVLKLLLSGAPGGDVSVERLLDAHRIHDALTPVAARMVARYAAILSGSAAFVASAADDDERWKGARRAR